ncbi:MAG: DUF418 domain-containing protein, partial [Gammaproteobacteria bacterium]|nr:DUF418 domain-containing protein [Gammaproteobacteria bacterium]
GERIVSLDVLRGIAVLGILVMNIYAFAMPFIAYANPLAMGGTELHNIGTWFFTHIFFDQKFLSIFAMLFGAGLILMTDRAEARGGQYGRIFYRRQFWLIIIGAVHGYLIWFGDILFMYAVIGMLVYLFRRRSPRTLIVIACLLLPLSLLMTYGFSISAKQTQAEASEIAALQDAGEEITAEQENLLEDWEEFRAFLAPTDEDLQKDLESYRGSYTEIVAHRAPIVASMQVFTTLFFGISRVAALMMIGMALMKLGVLSGERSQSFYRKLMMAGYLLGLPLAVFSAFDLSAHQWNAQYVMRVGGIANYLASLCIAFGHIGLILLVFKSGALQGILARFAKVGRMALTNYIMHSLILTTVFYGYGLGLYGTIPRFGQMGFVVLVILLQLFVSTWWLNRYRFGPIEWLWRSLTYWKRQSMRHE